MRTGYISRILPTLSETFVISEIRALQKLGMEIIPFSVHRPEDDNFQENARDIYESVTVFNRPLSPAMWFSHFSFLFSNPGRYFSTLQRYVFRPRLSLKNRLRALAQFMLAPHAAKQFRRAKLDHIHAHFAHIAAGIAMMGSRLAGIPYSFTIHAYGLFADNMLLHEKLRDAAFVATVSNYNIDYLARHYPVSNENRPHLVRCTVDTEQFHPGGRKTADSPLIVSVGRLVPMKGFPALVEACAALAKEFPELRCHIIGEGPQRHELEALIQRLGLEEIVILKGKMMQEAVREELNSAWVFALPACVRESSDNLPVALMESLAMEIPTVSTKVTAIPELIRDGETGLLIDPDSVDQLTSALRILLQQRQRAAEMAHAGRELVVREFTAVPNAARLQKLFTSGGPNQSDNG